MAVAPTSARVATSVCVLFGAGVGTSPWSGAEGADNKDRSESKRLVERSGALKSPALGTIYMRPGFARNNAQVDHTVATNLVGSIQLIRSASLTSVRKVAAASFRSPPAGAGRVPGNSMYHAAKVGIEGRGVGRPEGRALRDRHDDRGARRSPHRVPLRQPQVAELMPAPTDAPAHSFLKMLDPASGLAPGDPARMAARIIDSVDVEPAPLRIVLGSQALESKCATLRARIADFECARRARHEHIAAGLLELPSFYAGAAAEVEHVGAGAGGDDPIHQGVAGAGPGPVVAFRICAGRLCNLSLSMRFVLGRT